MLMDRQAALALLATADLIHDVDAISAAVNRVAREISTRLAESYPVVLCVLNGGVPFAGHLLTQLSFPLDFDYVHLTRYGSATTGGALSWRAAPSLALLGRTVLIIDDILDEGMTLAAIQERVRQLGAAVCYTAVLAEKMNGRKKAAQADFVALAVPDRFVFGFGMDVRGAWRNLPAIYAMRGE